MKNSFYVLLVLFPIILGGCFDKDGEPINNLLFEDYPVNCAIVNCLEEVEEVSGTLRFLDCFGYYGILVDISEPGDIYSRYKAGIIEDLAVELQEDLPKEVTFTGLYVEKEYPIQFPDPDISIASVNQLIVKDIVID